MKIIVEEHASYSLILDGNARCNGEYYNDVLRAVHHEDLPEIVTGVTESMPKAQSYKVVVYDDDGAIHLERTLYDW